MEYKVQEYLSSYQFFIMLEDIKQICKEDDQLLLDFTSVRRIDGNVIPNLILLGSWIESKTHSVPMIRLGQDFQAGYLKKYLDGIGFYKFTYGVFMYEDEDDKYCGYAGAEMDKKNGTMYFPYPLKELQEVESEDQKKEILTRDVEDAKRSIFQTIFLFLSSYMKKYCKFGSDDVIDRTADIMSQIVSNSILWGESEAYATIQANHKRKQIIVAVSDKGIGMRECIERKRKHPSYLKDGYHFFKTKALSEFESIVQSIYYRKDSDVYGIYNVIKDVLDLNGIVRIHSNDVQVILTDKTKEKFLGEDLHNNLSEYNKRKTEFFPGVHYEICIPMEKRV